MSSSEEKDVVVKVNIEGKPYKFHNKWVEYGTNILKSTNTVYTNDDNLILLIDGYLLSNERILFLIIAKTMYKPNLSITKNTNNILNAINNRARVLSKNINISKEEINSIITEVKDVYKIDKIDKIDDFSIEVNIEGKPYKFHNKWVEYGYNRSQTFTTSYVNKENVKLLIKGYLLSNERILFLIIAKTIYDSNLSIIENTDNIYNAINIQALKLSKTINISKEEINIIVRELKEASQKFNQQQLNLGSLEELKLYKFNHRIFGVVDCPFKLGEYLPKVYFNDFYIITNLIALCPFYDEKPKFGWINNEDKNYAWLAYIIKYHVNNFDYNTNKYVENIFCIPVQRSILRKGKGKMYIGWYTTTTTTKDETTKDEPKEETKLDYVIDDTIVNTIHRCHERRGVLVLPFSFYIYKQTLKDSFGHSCVLIINFQTKQILFSNPWGVVCKGKSCWKTETYNTTMDFIKYMKDTIINTQKIKYLEEFEILDFLECSPQEGPQGDDNLCSTWSMMIIHLYLLNYTKHSLYEIIEYIKTIVDLSSEESGKSLLAERYDYLTRKIIPAELSKEWYEKAKLEAPIGY